MSRIIAGRAIMLAPRAGVGPRAPYHRAMANIHLPLAPDDVTHVLYHADCPDGFGAAWAAWRRRGDQAQYQPVKHHEPPPTLPAQAKVLLVDFAYPRTELLKLKSEVGLLAVLDHHESSQKDLQGLDFAHFDMTHSGARLSWDWFHPDAPVPTLVDYIEDRDLWRWLLPNSRDITNGLNSYPQDFSVWTRLAQNMAELKLEGAAITRFQDRMIDIAVKAARVLDIGGLKVPTTNCTSPLTSEVGNKLIELYPDAPCVAVYSDAPGSRNWSLRSKGSFNVSELAARFGGGGHRNASGFRTPLEDHPVQPTPAS
ncbi:MAG TPA: phosphoesterase [Candidatus Xenobia bacterium]